MSRIWSCGFELQSATGGIEWDTSTGTMSISTSTKRSGAAALRCNPSAATGFLTHAFQADTVNRTLHRFYLNIATLPSADTVIYAYGDSGNTYPVLLRLKTTGVLQFHDSANYIGNASSALSTGTWYRIEVDYTDNATLASTALVGYVNGSNFSGAALTSQQVDGGGRVRLGVQTTCTADLYFDDVAINNSSGSVQNGLPGAGSIVHLRPDSAGDNAGFATTVGGTSNWGRVSETTPDDATTYNATTATGTTTIDDFNCGSSSGAGIGASDSITLVQVGARVGSSATTTASIVTRVKSQASGTVLESGSTSVALNGWSTHAAATPKVHGLTSYTDPQAGGAWTAALLDAIQIGYRSNVSQSSTRRVSTLWALVEYIPSVAGAAALTAASGLATDGIATAVVATAMSAATALSVVGQTATDGAAALSAATSITAAATVASSTRHNVCTNPSCTNNVTGWGGGSTPTRQTGLTGFPVTTGARYSSGTFMQTAAGAASPGLAYTVSMYVRPNGANASGGTLYLVFQRSSGGDDFSHTASLGTLNNGAVTRISLANVVAPANTTGIYLLVDGIGLNLGGAGNVDFTAVLAEQATAVDTWFDGDSAGATWDGTAGNSASTLSSGATVNASADLSASSALTAAAVPARPAATALTAAAALTSDGTATALAAAALSASSALTAAAVRDQPAAAALSAASALAVSATATLQAATTLTAAALLTADGTRDQPAVTALSAASALTVDATATLQAAAALAAATAVTAGATPIRPAATTLTVATTLTAAAARDQPAAVVLTAASTLTAAGVVTTDAAVALAAAAVLSAAGAVTTSGAVALASAATLTAAALGNNDAAATLATTTTLVVAGFVEVQAAVALTAMTDLAVDGHAQAFAAAALATAATLTAGGEHTAVAAVALTAVPLLSASALATRAAALLLAAHSALTAAAGSGGTAGPPAQYVRMAAGRSTIRTGVSRPSIHAGTGREPL